MRHRIRHRELPGAVEVNVTSLVDVAFTLLVIIITAPALHDGVEVDLSDARSAQLDGGDPVVVSLNAEGDVFLGATLVPAAGLGGAPGRGVSCWPPGFPCTRREGAPSGLLVRVMIGIRAAGGRVAVRTEDPRGPPR